MPSYPVFVFNQKPIADLTREAILESLLESDLATLCQQYGLDFAQIEPALDALQVMHVPGWPIFSVSYRPDGRYPLLVNQTPANAATVEQLPILREQASEWLATFLAEVNVMVTIEVLPVHLHEFGLLLTYELARWAAWSGKGIVLGLDRQWYRLNRHKAFLPLKGI